MDSEDAPAAVSPESVGEIEKLIGANTVSECSTPWRHVDLVTTGAATIPLLVKHFAVNAGPVELHLLAGRDLRPLQQTR